MTVSVTYAGNTYPIPEAGEIGWQSLTDYLVALAGGASTNNQLQSVRVVTAVSNNVLSTDYGVFVNFAGASTVVLPAGVTKAIFVIGDASGLAQTNNITINTTGGQLIDGLTSFTIKSNWGGVMVQFIGTAWKVLGEYHGSQDVVINDSTNTSFVDGAKVAKRPLASSANLTSCSASFTGSNSISIELALSTGESLLLHSSFLADSFTALSDQSSLFLTSDAGTGIYVSKSANSAVVTFKNRTGATKNIEIKSLTNRITSPTTWA